MKPYIFVKFQGGGGGGGSGPPAPSPLDPHMYTQYMIYTDAKINISRIASVNVIKF